MLILYIVVIIALIASFIADKKKTRQALIKSYKMFVKILPQFIIVLIAISLALYILPENKLVKLLSGKNIYISIFFAVALGSLALFPGFIIFPLSGILVSKGVPYAIISGFTVAVMNVGFLTMPVESKYFGTKMSLIRNVIFVFISIITAFVTGLFFKEF